MPIIGIVGKMLSFSAGMQRPEDVLAIDSEARLKKLSNDESIQTCAAQGGKNENDNELHVLAK